MALKPRKLRSFNEGSERTVVRRTSPSVKKAASSPRWKAPGFLLMVSLFIHGAYLGRPRSVVFDEVHFGKFITAYCCTKERFFDIHPPHAKLILAAAAVSAGYKGGFPFQNIGQAYGDVNPWALRWFPALMGALLPLLVWLLMRQLGASRPAAFLAGLAVTLDNALVLQSRVLGLDSILLSSFFGSLVVFLHALKRSTRKRWAWLLGAGALSGLAIGAKVTGAAGIGLMAVVLFCTWFGRRTLDNFKFGVKGLGLILLGAIPVYIAGFVLHFALLTKPGQGDAFFKPTASVVGNVVGLQTVMFRANYFLTATHPNSSKWWEWLIDRKPIFYWADGAKAIFLWGNPVLWGGISLLLLLILGVTVMGKVTSLKLASGGEKARSLQWIPLSGFVLSYLPMAFIPRALFLYHYFTPLVFGIIFVALWLDGAGWIVSSRLRKQRLSYYVVAALLVISFVVVSPVTYGFEASPQWHRSFTNFLHTWR